MNLLENRRRGANIAEKPQEVTIVRTYPWLIVNEVNGNTVSLKGYSTWDTILFKFSKPIKRFKLSSGNSSTSVTYVFLFDETVIDTQTANSVTMYKTFSDASCNKLYFSYRRANIESAYILDKDTGEILWSGAPLN